MQPTASNQPAVNDQTTASITLTCERCHESWIRRDVNKLPKTCPRCRSRYWQSPLTPYWEAKRQEQASIKQTEAQDLAAAQQRLKQFQDGQLNQADQLILYTCPHQAALEPIKHLCNFWLPENANPQPSAAQLYCIGNTIATTSEMLIHTIRDMISKEQLPHNKVLWAKLEGSQQYVYTFTKDGLIQTWHWFPIVAETKELS